MDQGLKNRVIAILEYFKQGLDDVEAGSNERQTMQDELDYILPLIKKRNVNNKIQIVTKNEWTPTLNSFEVGDEYKVNNISENEVRVIRQRAVMLKKQAGKVFKTRKDNLGNLTIERIK